MTELKDTLPLVVASCGAGGAFVTSIITLLKMVYENKSFKAQLENIIKRFDKHDSRERSLADCAEDYDEIISHKIGFFSFDEGLRQAAFEKMAKFRDVSLVNLEQIGSGLCTDIFIERLTAGNISCKQQIGACCGPEFADFYTDNFTYDAGDYVSDLRRILGDTLNNKRDRVHQLNKDYLNSFPSKMHEAFIAFKTHVFNPVVL